MLLSSHGRVAARVLAALSLSVLIGGGLAAHAMTPTRPVALDPVATTSVAIVPTAPVSQDTSAAVERGPFGLVVSHDSGLASRWRRLQPVIHVEAEVLSLCRAHPQMCTPAAARFLSIIDTARARTGLARIGEINRAINLAIRPMSDKAQFGAPDVWMTPLMTFATGAGDCEDYAIAKYVALRQAGMAARDLRLVILHNRLAHEDHAVTAARLHGHWLILDNQRMALLTDHEMRNVTPLLALDSAPNEASPVVASTPVVPGGSADKDRLTADRSSGATITVSDVFFTDPGKTAPGLPLAMAA
jgi:predicted transglutaminase-like cysteine proteinase